MDTTKQLSDIEDISDEFNKLNQRLKLVNDRFQAVSFDFKYYIDDTWEEKKIFELRDNIRYRLFSSKFHIELLLQQHKQIEYDLKHRFKVDPEFFSRRYITGNPLYEFYGDQVSSIFDSIIFHCVSVFDYLSTLCNYVCGNDNLDKFKWTKLTKAVRDKGNPYSKTKISDVVTKVDREFVGKLYDHRSHVIHYKSDPNKYSISMNVTHKSIDFVPRFLIGDDLTKKFAELRNLSKTNNITTKYAAFWLLNQTIDKINEVLFSLKEQMESFPKITFPTRGLYDELTQTLKPMSTDLWKLNEK